MNKTPLVLGLLLAAQAALVQAAEPSWHPVIAGCHDQSVGSSLRSWRDAPHSSSSLRLAVEPDGGRGPTILVALDQGLNRALQADGEPILIAAVGDRFRTCVHRMPLSACDAAAQARRDLLSLQVPVGYGFDSDFILRLHATTYHLQWSDGSGNGNAIEHTDSGHPVAVAVARAVVALEQCLAPAVKAFEDDRRSQ